MRKPFLITTLIFLPSCTDASSIDDEFDSDYSSVDDGYHEDLASELKALDNSHVVSCVLPSGTYLVAPGSGDGANGSASGLAYSTYYVDIYKLHGDFVVPGLDVFVWPGFIQGDAEGFVGTGANMFFTFAVPPTATSGSATLRARVFNVAGQVVCQSDFVVEALEPEYQVFLNPERNGFRLAGGSNFQLDWKEPTQNQFCIENGYDSASYGGLDYPTGSTYTRYTGSNWTVSGNSDIHLFSTITCVR